MKIVLILLIFFISTVVKANSQDVTKFEDFYKPEESFNLINSALIGGAFAGLVFTGPVSAPILIGAGVAFSADLGLDYATSRAADNARHNDFITQSNLLSFPLPTNTDGSDFYKKTLSELKGSQGAEDDLFEYSIASLKLRLDRIGLDEKESALLAILKLSTGQLREAYDFTNKYSEIKDGNNQIILMVNHVSRLNLPNNDINESIQKFNVDVFKISNDYKPMVYTVYLNALVNAYSSGRIDYTDLTELADSIFALEQSGYLEDIISLYNLTVLLIAAEAKEIIEIVHKYKNDKILEDRDLIKKLSIYLDKYILLSNLAHDLSVFNLRVLEESIDSQFVTRRWQHSLRDYLFNIVNELNSIDTNYEELRLLIVEVDEFITSRRTFLDRFIRR